MQLALFDLPWWAYVLVTLGLTHVTIAAVTIFLHRHQAHRALDLHPIASHFFRFWLWLTTGMATREWVAIHRKHHARSDLPEDPHSPQIHGIRKVLFEGVNITDQDAGPMAEPSASAKSDPGLFYSTQAVAEDMGFIKGRELIEGTPGPDAATPRR